MTDNSVENRLDFLAAEIEQLKGQVNNLEERLTAREASPPPNRNRQLQTQLSSLRRETPLKNEESGEDFWSWLGNASLLPRIATISFALVLALLLRTLTDNQVIAKPVGSLIGIGYAGLLILLGWRLLAGKHRLGPVFPVCGGILMFLIVLETHTRFAVISSASAYGILFVTLLVLVMMGSRYAFPFLVTLGILGGSISAYTINFPDPYFPVLAFFLFAANIISYVMANKPPHKESARWGIFFLTALLWIHWTAKLVVPLGLDLAVSPSLGFSWYLPFLAFYSILYFGVTIHRAFVIGRLTPFDSWLPTASGLLFYLAARSVLVPWLGIETWPGIVGLGWAGLLFLTAAIAAQTGRASSLAACIFTFAGAVLLLLTVPDVTGNLLLALPIWSLGGLFLIKLSGRCEVGGIRLASYILQVTACGAGVAFGGFSIQTGNLPLSLAVAGTLAVLSAIHYQTSRLHPISCSAGFFNKVDPHDRTAIFLLIATLVNGFAMLQLGAVLLLGASPMTIQNTINGLRSVFINVGAFLLVVLGIKTLNKEILGVALTVFLVGAGKVFGYDLFQAHGVPLVLSVFSFGIVAALGSVVLSRRQRLANSP